MHRLIRTYSAAVIAALCFTGFAGAQESAVKDLLGGYENLDAAVSPAGMTAPVPEKMAYGSLRDEFLYVDTGHVVPERPLAIALKYYKEHKAEISNPGYLSVIDYTQSSGSKRFYVINMRTGAVERFLTAHGRGSDPNHTGYASFFSNKDDTHASSLGFFRTGDTYDGENGYSLRLNGLSPTNSNALDRAIVIHGADYVASGGRSWGCPAVEMPVRTRLINTLKNGSLIYAYHERFSRE